MNDGERRSVREGTRPEEGCMAGGCDVEAPLLVRHAGGKGSKGRDGVTSAEGRGGSTWSQTLMNIVVSIVGTGVLGLPYAFRVSGWLAGSLGVAVAGLTTYYTMMLLVECRKRLEEDDESSQIESYGDVGFMAFGERGRFLTEILVLISQSGGAIAYLIFIGQNLSSLFHFHSDCIPSAVFIFGLLLPLEIALSFVRSLSTISWSSAFADACNVLAMVIVFKDDLEQLNRVSEIQMSTFNGLWGLTFASGVAVFCFEGFSMTLPLEASMTERKKFAWVLCSALFCISAVYILFGFAGYIAYGEKTKDIVTLNLPNDWTAVVVKVGLCLALAFTFPIMMHPIHDIFETRLKKSVFFLKFCSQCDGAEQVSLHVVRAALVMVMAIIASFITEFGTFISFVGSTVCALLSFVLPAAFHLRFLRSSMCCWKRLLDYCILIAGLLFAAYGTYSAASGNSMG